MIRTTGPVRSLCDGSERSERRDSDCVQQVSIRCVKAPVRDTGIRGDEGAWRVMDRAMSA